MPDMHLHHSEHHEQHFQSSDAVRDVVIGLSDGLTVPFALAAGLAGAVAATHVVILAGLAEIAAGSIAMGLGGYLASRGDSEHYAAERRREEMEVVHRPRDEEEEIYEIFSAYGVARDAATPVLRSLQANPPAYVDFMMRFELGLEAPAAGRAWRSALTIALAYIVGGFVPLAPYLINHSIAEALRLSVIITLIALLIFGGLKGRLLGSPVLRSAIQTMLIGGFAAGAAFALARLLNGHS
ncbi:MAG TPA: VIT1/CCC1 transporter family protein [Candidatus Aquilonibacter sp.]|nr:VIT1/CCC1 transporter family protein [Candidatus Aquilonibacter sp.]